MSVPQKQSDGGGGEQGPHCTEQRHSAAMPSSGAAAVRCWLAGLVLVGCASRAAGFQTSGAWSAAPGAARPSALACRRSAGAVPLPAAGAAQRWGVRGVSAQASSLPNLECVKNTRDLASVTGSPVKPGRVFRTSCVGTASDNDSCVIVENIKTLIDLRSDKEYNMDGEKYNSTVWENYDDMIYSVKKSKSGRAKALVAAKAEVPRPAPRAPCCLSVCGCACMRIRVCVRARSRCVRACVRARAAVARRCSRVSWKEYVHPQRWWWVACVCVRADYARMHARVCIHHQLFPNCAHAPTRPLLSLSPPLSPPAVFAASSAHAVSD